VEVNLVFFGSFGALIKCDSACGQEGEIRAFTVASIYRIKNLNITKNWENRITAASPNERNTEADEQWLLEFEEQLFILLSIN
jgi:hypothetical protein